nr:type VII secretion protein EccCb [Agromyces protaetiae]
MSGRGPVAHRVWLPPLETPPSLDQMFGDLVADPGLGLVSPSWRAAGNLTVPLGIVDVPLEQRREPLVVSLAGSGGHVAIVGAPLSGKSTLARTLMTSLSMTRTPLETQWYVLDFGGGTFVGLAGFPHLAGVASRSEPEVVRRAVAEVQSILDARERFFRDNGIDSIETYRQRRAAGLVDDGYGDVFLVVDGWATLRAEFEQLEGVVQAIAARGLTFGVHVVITAARWMEIRAAMKDLIGTRLELRLGDPSDSEINRKSAANVTTLAGRGLDPRGLQMLTALPRVDGVGDSSSLADGVSDLVVRAAAAWQGPAAPKLRLLPELIGLDQIRAAVAPDLREFVLGVDEADIAPVLLDPTEEPHLYLYGDSESGKSSMLRAYAQEIMRHYGPKEAKIFVVDYRRANLGEIPPEYLGAYLTGHDQAMSGVAELAAFFQSRIPGPDVTAEQLRTRSWWTGAEGFVLVDDYDLVATSQGNPLAALAPLLAQAGDLGLHVVLTRRTGGASRAAYDPIIQRFTDLGVTGILLSGNPEEGQLIGRVKPIPAVPGRAQIVSRSRGLFTAQLAWAQKEFG